MSKRKLNHRRNRNAQYYAEELVNILEVLEKRQRRENTLSSDQKDTNEWENDGNGHHTKYSDEKPRNSADDNSVIITYRKMSDKTDDDMNTETKDDDLDEEIYLRTLTLRIPNSRSLRSRKNRTGLWLEENERDEIEHIIDEMNPTKLQREDIDPDESEDFQDAVSDMSAVILEDAGTTTLPSDISRNINTHPMKNASTMKDMDRKSHGFVYFYYYLAAIIFIGLALLYFSLNMLYKDV
ncbi:uncharacterized protein [Magallana gigas]|uniref:uncharacterized protein isoform X2 n=1 Tax=Magallana gigas TaxID=29159 RepID=UPI00333EE09A